MMKYMWPWLALGMVSQGYAEREFHVSADAAVGGDGSRGRPFQTLTQARDGIRAARQAGTLKSGEAVTGNVESGVDRLSGSFELSAKDSGTAEAPVVYRARSIGQARVWGGVALEAFSFKPVTDAAARSRFDAAVRDKILVCDLSAKVAGDFPNFKTSFHGVPAAPWLYVNHQPMTLARWPNLDATNAGWAGFSKAVDTGLPKADATDPALRKLHPGSFLFDDPRTARWNLSEGVWLLGRSGSKLPNCAPRSAAMPAATGARPPRPKLPTTSAVCATATGFSPSSGMAGTSGSAS